MGQLCSFLFACQKKSLACPFSFRIKYHFWPCLWFFLIFLCGHFGKWNGFSSCQRGGWWQFGEKVLFLLVACLGGLVQILKRAFSCQWSKKWYFLGMLLYWNLAGRMLKFGVSVVWNGEWASSLSNFLHFPNLSSKFLSGIANLCQFLCVSSLNGPYIWWTGTDQCCELQVE